VHKNLETIHTRMNQLSPNISSFLNVYKDNYQLNLNIAIKKSNSKSIKFSTMPLNTLISNYYQTTAVEKASKIMQKCAEELNLKKNNFSKL
jgi:capsular polysaccharide biosynthesis protein